MISVVSSSEGDSMLSCSPTDSGARASAVDVDLGFVAVGSVTRIPREILHLTYHDWAACHGYLGEFIGLRALAATASAVVATSD